MDVFLALLVLIYWIITNKVLIYIYRILSLSNSMSADNLLNQVCLF